MSAPRPISELAQALREQHPALRRAAAFSVVASLLALASTAYMFEVYDRVVNSRSAMTLGMLTIAVLIAYALMAWLEQTRAALLRAAADGFDRRLAPRAFEAAWDTRLRADGPPAGAQPLHDLRTLREFFTGQLVGALLEAPVALVFLVLLFALDVSLGVLALGGAVIHVGLTAANDKATREPLVASGRAAAAARHEAAATRRHAETVRAMGMGDDVRRRWATLQSRHLALQAQASDAAGIYQAAGRALQSAMSSMLLGLSAWLALGNNLPGGAGMMIVASVLGGRVLAPLVQAVAQWSALSATRVAWARLDDTLARSPKPAASMALPRATGRLAVESLVAAAPGGKTALLKGVAFALEPGEVLAVVGASGAGKTTLARLLAGTWPATGGSVRLDGVDVHRWDKAELGPQVGYLPQGVELLDGTIAENIARFGDVRMADVECAARSAGLHEHVSALPHGYDTQVGTDGVMLSGGQRQRVGLARALYGDPVFVVLDEPNASLDESGEALLAQAIAARKAAGTTFVVMTQRTGVLAVADKLLVLNDGAQQAFGPRDQVLAALARPPAPAAAATARPAVAAR